MSFHPFPKDKGLLRHARSVRCFWDGVLSQDVNTSMQGPDGETRHKVFFFNSREKNKISTEQNLSAPSMENLHVFLLKYLLYSILLYLLFSHLCNQSKFPQCNSTVILKCARTCCAWFGWTGQFWKVTLAPWNYIVAE